MRNYQAGDVVKFLNEVGGGVVTKTGAGDLVFVQTEDGFEIPCLRCELILVTESKEPATAVDQIAEVQVGLPFEAVDEAVVEDEPFIDKYRIAPHIAEVDMHIWELVADYSRMTNGEMVGVQLDFLVNCLESAIEQCYRNVIFIHGVGNGTLRREVREILSRYPEVEYYDAPMRKYGVGATEVRIHQVR